MKKMNKILAAVLVGFIGVGVAHAQTSATLTCEDLKLVPGASTICTVKITPDATAASSTTPTKTFIASIAQSQYLTMSDVKVNTTAGFSNLKEQTDSTNALTNIISLDYTGTVTADKEIEVFSFKMTLSKEAENLPDGNCGQLCLSSALFDSNSVTLGDDGKPYCPNFSINKPTCVGEDCNPTTGEFMNYAIIAGVCVVALAAIVIVSKKNKFYNV